MTSRVLSQKIEESFDELREHRKKATLHALLHRFVVETGKQDEFLNWVAKDMGLDIPMDLTKLDALIEECLGAGQ